MEITYSSLNELITYLEYGTKLHIGVVFLGNHGNELLQLPFSKSIHPSPFCSEMKKDPRQKKRCFRCRTAALQKAIQTQAPFGGLCAYGVYEYTHPLVINKETTCVIYVGNIYPQERQFKINNRLKRAPDLKKTLEENFDADRCEAVAKLVESYIRMILETNPSPKKDGQCNQLIENVKKYVQENIEYNITLSLVAQLYHYNEKYLGRLFSKEVGMSFHEYINRQRLSYAKTLLKTTRDSILNIALRVGFQNVTYFNRIFKKEFHITPSEYRKEKSGEVAR